MFFILNFHEKSKTKTNQNSLFDRFPNIQDLAATVTIKYNQSRSLIPADVQLKQRGIKRMTLDYEERQSLQAQLRTLCFS